MKKSFIAASMLVSSVLILAGCANTKPSNSTIGNDPNRHYVSGTIHDFDIDYSRSVKFVENGVSDYSIYLADSSEEGVQAANYLALQVTQCTGYSLPIVNIERDAVIVSTDKAIIIGSDASFLAAGLTKTEKEIGVNGYQLVTKDNAVYIRTKGRGGYQLGVLKFLEIVCGYDLIYGDYITFDKDGSSIPSMNIVERPDFDYRKIDDKDTTWRYGAGFTDNMVFIPVNGNQYHNSFDFLPPEEYIDEHPNWYNLYNPATKHDRGQLCYTAHSHPEEIPLMQAIAAENMIRYIDAYPQLNNITFTIQDNYDMCGCYGQAPYTASNPDPKSCLGKMQHYNGANSGVIIEFVNGIDDIVQEHYRGTGREIIISFFAYHGTELAPTAENKKGGYYAIDGLKSNDTVQAFVAPVSSNFINSFYNLDKNPDANMKFKSWMSVSKNMSAWIYDTSYGEYLYAFNTFTTMPETYRFLKECGLNLLYCQSQHGASCRTAFNRLKLYISSKTMINVNADVGPIIDKFFSAYYLDGASYMREFYDELITWMLYQEKQWPLVFTGAVSGAHHYLATSDYWNEQMLKKWEKACYKAIESVSELQYQDPYRYKQVSDAMMVESIFPRWAICNLFDSSYTESEVLKMRMDFKRDADRLGFDEYAEGKALKDYYTNTWGI